jgi:hypothetical protein
MDISQFFLDEGTVFMPVEVLCQVGNTKDSMCFSCIQACGIESPPLHMVYCFHFGMFFMQD